MKFDYNSMNIKFIEIQDDYMIEIESAPPNNNNVKQRTTNPVQIENENISINP